MTSVLPVVQRWYERMESSGDIHRLPSVSIVTVVRNGREFIEQTIKSVLGQTYPHIDYIVVDGASTDGTTEIIRRYSARIAKSICEPDSGIAEAFNKGLGVAAGDYILFLNSDDRLATPETISHMVQAIIANDYPVLIYGDYVIVDRQTDAEKQHCSVRFNRRRFLRGGVLPHPCLLTHRRYFDKYGNFDTSFRIAMDYEWMLRGALECRVLHIPLEMTIIRDGGLSVNNPATRGEIVGALRKNGFARTLRAQFGIWSYFFLRSLARKSLELTGLYPFLLQWRRQR